MLSPNLKSLSFENNRHQMSGISDDLEVKIPMCVCERERQIDS